MASSGKNPAAPKQSTDAALSKRSRAVIEPVAGSGAEAPKIATTDGSPKVCHTLKITICLILHLGGCLAAGPGQSALAGAPTDLNHWKTHGHKIGTRENQQSRDKVKKSDIDVIVRNTQQKHRPEHHGPTTLDTHSETIAPSHMSPKSLPTPSKSAPPPTPSRPDPALPFPPNRVRTRVRYGT